MYSFTRDIMVRLIQAMIYIYIYREREREKHDFYSWINGKGLQCHVTYRRLSRRCEWERGPRCKRTKQLLGVIQDCRVLGIRLAKVDRHRNKATYLLTDEEDCSACGEIYHKGTTRQIMMHWMASSRGEYGHVIMGWGMEKYSREKDKKIWAFT